MKLLIDNTAADTGWSNVLRVNEIPDYITNDFSGSLIFDLNQNVVGQKTFSSIDVSNYDELVFNAYVVDQGGKQFYTKSDFHLKIVINGTDYFVPNYRSLTSLSIPLGAINTITSIGFSHNYSSNHKIVVSGIWAVADEFPKDIFQGMTEGIQREVTRLYTNGIRIGTVTGSSGDTSVTISGDNSYVSRYTVILIDDGVNQYRHQLLDGDDRTHRLGQLYDGSALTTNFSNADVWVYYSVEFGFIEEELAVPSIHVWGFGPAGIPFESKAEERIEGYSGDDWFLKRTGQLSEYTLQIEAEARSYHVMSQLTTAVRHFLSKEVIWVNGRKLDFDYDSVSELSEPDNPNRLLPRVTYQFPIQIREDVWPRISRRSAQTANLSVALQ